MKHNNDGFSLVEIVAAIAILGIFFGTACSGLVLGLRMNEKTDAMLQAQLAVSSAVETLMAEGIAADSDLYELVQKTNNGTDVKNVFEIEFNEDVFETSITAEVERQTVTNESEAGQTEGTETLLPYFKVTVTSTVENVTVTTYIREKVVTES